MGLFDNCQNTRHQGNLGVSSLIDKLTKKGFSVFLPFGETKDYDLVFDDGVRLNKVQVRTTSERAKSKKFVVHLRVMGGNRSFHTAKLFDNSKVDFLYVLTDEGTSYLIPSSLIFVKTSLTLTPTMDKYKIS